VVINEKAYKPAYYLENMKKLDSYIGISPFTFLVNDPQ